MRYSLPATILSAYMLCSAAARAQDAAPTSPETQQPAAVTDGDREIRFTFGGGYTHRFESDLSEGDGTLGVDALTGGLNVATDLSNDLSLAFRLNFGVTDYEFDGGTTGIGALEPWNTVHAVAFGVAATLDLSDQWSIFGGPMFQFSRESGADWTDSFTGGVIAGATFKVHDHFVVGGGLGVSTAIEDDVRIFPILILEWAFNDQFRLSSRGATGGRTSIEFTGIEFIWMPAEQWEFALGAGSSYSRFRLDDDGIAPDGVGQDESTPVWLRASFRPSDNIMIDAVAGIGFGGEVSLDDENGDPLGASDYDAPLFIGLFGSVKF